MDLAKELLKPFSKAETAKLVDYIKVNPVRFKALLEMYLRGPYRLTQRAAGPLAICVKSNPSLILPHFKEVLKVLEQPTVHDSIKRNTLRIIQFAEIPKKYHGKLIDLCFRYLSDKKEPVAIKAFSMTVLAMLLQRQPELYNELKIIIEDQLPYSSPGFVSRARKILKKKF